MKTFEAHQASPDSIVLKKQKAINDLIQTIEDNEDFILTWVEGEDHKSLLMIATNLLSRIKTGDMEIAAKEEGGNKNE